MIRDLISRCLEKMDFEYLYLRSMLSSDNIITASIVGFLHTQMSTLNSAIL